MNYFDTAFLDTVTDHSAASWKIQIDLNGTSVCFKLDTGAEVTAISLNTFQILHNIKLTKPLKTLCGPSRAKLNVIGQFQGTFTYATRSTSQPVYVVKDLKSNLLGLPVITALRLVERLDALTEVSEDIPKLFPTLFTGLGNLGDEYHIHLKCDAKPFAIFTP